MNDSRKEELKFMVEQYHKAEVALLNKLLPSWVFTLVTSKNLVPDIFIEKAKDE